MLQMQTTAQQQSNNCSSLTMQQQQQQEKTRFNRKSNSNTPPVNLALHKPSTTSIMKKNQNTESVKKWLLKSIVSFKTTDSENKPVQTSPQLIHYHNNDGGLSYSTTPRDVKRINGVGDDDDGVDMNDDAINNTNRNFDVPKDEDVTNDSTTYSFCRHAIRSTNMDKSIEAKKKVIRMLFVIIVEFFVCWAPIHIMNTVRFFE